MSFGVANWGRPIVVLPPLLKARLVHRVHLATLCNNSGLKTKGSGFRARSFGNNNLTAQAFMFRVRVWI